MCAQGVVMHCTGSDSIKVTTQLKTSENSWEHRKTPKIIWYHPENNWGPLIDDLVHFEEDFNSQTEMWSGRDRLCQTSPIPRSPDGDNKCRNYRVNMLRVGSSNTRPLSAPFLFRTSGKGTDMATPLGPEKYGRIDFSLGRWTTMGQNAPKLVLKHAKEQVELVRIFLRSLLRPQESLFWRSSFICCKKY